MKVIRSATLALALGQIAPSAGDIVSQVRIAAEERNFTLAEHAIQAYRATAGLTPEFLEALSWMSRGALDAKQYDRADNYSAETRKLVGDVLHAGRTLDQEPRLPLALGAGIEVHARVLLAR